MFSIPRECGSDISPGLLMFADGPTKKFFRSFGILLGVFGLYGTLVLHQGERPHHSALMFLLGPWIFPSLVALCFTFSPFRPYRGIVYLQNTRDVDVSDPAILRLISLFKSPEAKRQLWRQTFNLSAIIFVVLAALAIIMRKSLTWLPSMTDLGGSALALVGSLVAVSSDYIGWCIATWLRQERELKISSAKSTNI